MNEFDPWPYDNDDEEISTGELWKFASALLGAGILIFGLVALISFGLYQLARGN